MKFDKWYSETIVERIDKLLETQQDVSPEIVEAVNDNFWDLI